MAGQVDGRADLPYHPQTGAVGEPGRGEVLLLGRTRWRLLTKARTATWNEKMVSKDQRCKSESKNYGPPKMPESDSDLVGHPIFSWTAFGLDISYN